MSDPRRAKRKLYAAVVGATFAFGVLRFGYRYLDHVARRDPGAALRVFLEEATGAIGAIVPLFALVALVHRLPLTRRTLRTRLPAYVALMLSGSFAHTWFMGASRRALWPLFSLGTYDYGIMRVRYFMELANDTAIFWMVVGILLGVAAHERAQAQKVAEAELRAELARAQVESLERRLHPHFLFNALNTISAIMYEDPAAADRMISGLSDLLRRALASGSAQEVPLDEELDLLERYLDIMRARFDDRLMVKVDVEEGAKGAMVPPMLLQPLVENAIRHGVDPHTHRVDAALTARRDGESLLLELRDHGRGIAQGSDPAHGIGLSATAKRLSTMYGAAQRLALENAEGGGLRVTIALPFRRLDDARPPG